MNVLIIVFSLIFLTPNSMLNNDQATTIQQAYQSYQALVAHCKQHNLDINTILSPAQKKELKGGMEFLKTWMPEVKTVMAAMDIPEPTFVDAVVQWRDDFIVELKKLSKENTNVSILAAKLKDNISLGNSSFVINQQILLPMLNGIISNAADQDVATLCATVQNALATQLTNAIITTHYNDNKGGGKGKKKKSGYIDDTRTFTEVMASLPSIDNIIQAILDSRDLNDEDHPDKKEEEQAQRAEFDQEFDNWQLKMMDELGKADTASDDSLASYAKVEKELKKVFSKSDAKLLNDYLQKEVETKIKVKKGIRVADLRDLLTESVKNSHEAIAVDSLFEEWKSFPKLRFPISTAFRGALTMSKLDVSYDVFKNKVNLIAGSTQTQVIDTVAGANQKRWEKVADSREVKFTKAALISEFELAFGKIVQGAKPVGFVYDALVSELNGASKEIPLDEVKAIWKTALAAAKSTAYKGEDGSAYKTWVDTLGLWQVEMVLDSIESSFPNLDIVTAVLEEALVRPKSKAKLKPRNFNMEDAVVAECAILWRNVPSLISTVMEEGAQESMLKAVKDKLKELGQGVELVIKELEGISSLANIPIKDLPFKLKIPMQLKESYNNKGQKYIMAIPGDLDANNVRINGGGYYNLEVLRLYTLSTNPKEIKTATAQNSKGQTIMSVHCYQELIVEANILDPQIAVSGGGVELTKNPCTHPIEIKFNISTIFYYKEEYPKDSNVVIAIKYLGFTDSKGIVRDIRNDENIDKKLSAYQ